MISCKRATELISKSMEEKLSLSEELSLRLHNFICEFCERFQRQVQLLRQMLASDTKEPSGAEKVDVPAEAKKRVMKRLQAERSDDELS